MKKEINRTLGNSLRCILPSFWWKRLLGKMVDKIESAESSASSAMKMATLAGLEASDKQDRLVSGSNIKTICGNSILGSGNITPDPSMKVYIPMGGTLSSYYKSDNQSFYRRVRDGGNWVNSWRAIAVTASSNKEVVLLGVSYNTTQGCRILISGFQEEDITDKYECVLLEDGSVSSVTKAEGESGGSSITIDSEISDTSENPVQNKVVKAYVDEKVANSGGGSSVDVDTELSNTSTNPVQNKVITNAINAKADNTRIDLISERLDDIDSEMKDFATESQLNNKQDVITDLDNIRQGAAKGATALQSIPSEYVTENELSAKNYATTSQVNAKQDVISDIETIRSGADKGATSIQKVIVNGTEFEPTAGIVDLGELSTEDVDTSSFATKDELIDNEETHATALVDINSRKVDNESFEQNSILTNQHISSILNNVEELEDDVLINENIHAAALTDLNSRKANIKYVDDSIVTIDKQIQVVEQDIIDGEYVHTAALNDINSRKPDKEYIDVAIFNVNKYASSISAILTTLSNDVVIDESVHAAAFNDINTRKSDKTYVDSSVTEVNERVADVIDNVTDGELTHASAFIYINDRKADKEYVDNAIIDTNKNISNVSNEFGILESGVIDSENIYASAIIDLENRKVEKSYVDNELATFLSEFIRFKNEGVPVIDVTDDVIIIEPNKYYKWTNAMSSITVTLHTPTTSGTLNNYMFEFKVSASGCTLTVPAGVKWANGEPPELKVNKTYQVSIINNLAVTSMFG
jgi:hypothetical protein